MQWYSTRQCMSSPSLGRVNSTIIVSDALQIYEYCMSKDSGICTQCDNRIFFFIASSETTSMTNKERHQAEITIFFYFIYDLPRYATRLVLAVGTICFTAATTIALLILILPQTISTDCIKLLHSFTFNTIVLFSL